jgi:hypothetical protein
MKLSRSYGDRVAFMLKLTFLAFLSNIGFYYTSLAPKRIEESQKQFFYVFF